MMKNGFVRGHMNKDYKPNDDVYTPPELFEALGLQFDLDVCAPKGGLPWIPAKRNFTIEDDGLTQKWIGRVWMNPPFSAPKLWVAKWLAHGNGVMLAPLSKSNWFMDLWMSDAAILNNPVKFRFIKPDGSRYSIAFPTAIWAIGDENVEALRKSNLGKIR